MLAISADTPPLEVPLPVPVDADRGEHLRDTFELLSPGDLALLIGIDERTLAVWRCQKRGPDFVRLGRSVFYRRADVHAWVELNVMQTDRAAA